MKVGIIGGGRVGSCLAGYLADTGRLVGIVDSTEEKTQQLAARFQVEALTKTELLKMADVVLLTVPDRLVGVVAAEVAELLPEGAATKVVLHTSGSLTLEPLAALAERQLHVGSLHPLQSFAGGQTKTQLKGVYMAVDGDEEAQQAARELVTAFGGHAFTVPTAERAAYHAAACICSNYAVVVEALATQLMARWTGSEAAAWQALLPLFKGTSANLLQTDNVGSVLTGPIARGDASTVAKHLAVLPGQYQNIYASLGLAATQLALAEGNIDVTTAHELENLLRNVEG